MNSRHGDNKPYLINSNLKIMDMASLPSDGQVVKQQRGKLKCSNQFDNDFDDPDDGSNYLDEEIKRNDYMQMAIHYKNLCKVSNRQLLLIC